VNIDAAVLQANALLSSHALAALRIAAWDPATQTLLIEVFHLDWGFAIGALEFSETSYLQLPSSTEWGYALRIAPDAVLPSRGDADGETVFEFATHDGCGPTFYVAARGLAFHPKRIE
jgi:hypothetical protein